MSRGYVGAGEWLLKGREKFWMSRKKKTFNICLKAIQCGYTKIKQDFFFNFVLSVHHIPFRTRFATCARDHGNTVHNLENTITFLMSPINCTTQMIELYAYIYTT